MTEFGEFRISTTQAEVTIIRYLGNDKPVVIPSDISGMPVANIENYAFYNCRLTNVTIPDSVTNIGKSAFDRCGKLASVTIPNSVTTIGDYAFSECRSLTSVTIPDSVVSIGKSAFIACDHLTSIVMPDSVTRIGDRAFEHCNNLTIQCPAGSYAETYAKNMKIPYSLT